MRPPGTKRPDSSVVAPRATMLTSSSAKPADFSASVALALRRDVAHAIGLAPAGRVAEVDLDLAAARLEEARRRQPVTPTVERHGEPAGTLSGTILVAGRADVGARAVGLEREDEAIGAIDREPARHDRLAQARALGVEDHDRGKVLVRQPKAIPSSGLDGPRTRAFTVHAEAVRERFDDKAMHLARRADRELDPLDRREVAGGTTEPALVLGAARLSDPR